MVYYKMDEKASCIKLGEIKVSDRYLSQIKNMTF